MNFFTQPGVTPDVMTLGVAELMKQKLAGVDLVPLFNQIVERAKNPANAGARMDLSILLQFGKLRDDALMVQADALRTAQLYSVAGKADAHALRILLLKSVGDLHANTPLECILEHGNCAVQILYVDAGLPIPPELPDHDLLFVTLSESVTNRPLLEELARLSPTWPRPFLNSPARILLLSREASCDMLAGAPGIVMPRTLRISRAHLQRVASGEMEAADVFGDFPIIARPVDSHAGENLQRIENVSDLAVLLHGCAFQEFFIAAFVDYSSPDGLYRKYRIVLIEGRPFVCHMGISSEWIVHYPYEEMILHADRRQEEARVALTFDDGFALRHAAAFEAIHKGFQLDYMGLDCAESRNGELVIFEVASAMLVHAMDDREIFPYKQPQMQKVFAAFFAMLHRKLGQRAVACRQP